MSDPILSMFNNILYTVELDPTRWVERMEQGCQALERFFPESPLVFDQDSEGPVKNRLRYLQSRLKKKIRSFGLTNGRPQNQMNIQVTGYVDIGGQMYLGGLIYRLGAAIPATTLEMGETVFAALGDAVQAYFSQVKPYKACGQLEGYNQLLYARIKQISLQDRSAVQIEGEKLTSHVEKLGLHLPLINKYPVTPHLHPAQPFELGWLNYWSAETCEYIGFPDPERDRDLLALSYPTPGGAWLVKICPEPLDLDREDHLRLFVELYQRFPKLGLREGKVEPPPPFRYPEHTIYIHAGNPGDLVQGLVHGFQVHGYRRVESLPNPPLADGVILGLIPGAPDWTIVKSLPEDFLAKPGPGQEEPWLVSLCRELRCGGFTLNVLTEIEALLLETDGKETLCRSGIPSFAELPEDVDFEAMDESGMSPLLEFRLHDLEIETGVGDFDDYGQIAGQVHELLAGPNADWCDDRGFVESLTGNGFKNRQGIRLCFLPATS